jgi:hypothetical protein
MTQVSEVTVSPSVNESFVEPWPALHFKDAGEDCTYVNKVGIVVVVVVAAATVE